MTTLPVIDLLDSVVVRGVAGRRSEYRPIVSALVDSADPLTVARAFRAHFGLNALYVADLDAIVHSRPNRDIYRELSRDGFLLHIDAGLHTAAEADELFESGATQVIAGLETIGGPDVLQDLSRRAGGERVAFSVDLKDGRVLRPNPGWSSDDPLEIAGQAVAAGVGTLIVLDLAGVGVGGGVPTVELCRRIRARHPQVTLITGGGVRGIEDLHRLSAAGLDGVLIASALHDGRVTPDEIALFRTQG